jgi:hypothetical protein
MWSLFERIHDVTYFAPQARSAFEAAGLRGFWRGYFAGRAAPLGPVGPGPVLASFFGFAPAMVTRALPDVWTRLSPEATLAARRAGAAEALRAVLADVDVDAIAEVSELLRAAALAVRCHGRVLGAANADLPWPEGDPIEVLWHAATILREHRGDGHVAALLVAGLDGAESLVWRDALVSGGREFLQPARGWTDEEWANAALRLTARGWLTADGKATDVAHIAYEEAEAITDRLAAGPWDHLGEAATERCAELLRPIAERAETYLPLPNPIGLSPL